MDAAQEFKINMSMDNLFYPVAMGMAITARKHVIESGLGGRYEPLHKSITPANTYALGMGNSIIDLDKGFKNGSNYA